MSRVDDLTGRAPCGTIKSPYREKDRRRKEEEEKQRGREKDPAFNNRIDYAPPPSQKRARGTTDAFFKWVRELGSLYWRCRIAAALRLCENARAPGTRWCLPVLYETRKLVKCVIMLDGGCRTLSGGTPSFFDRPLLRYSFVSPRLQLSFPLFFSPKICRVFFPAVFYPPCFSLLPVSLSLSLFHVRDAKASTTVILVDHTWRAKLSLLTLCRDAELGDRLGSSLKVDNNVTPDIPWGPHAAMS